MNYNINESNLSKIGSLIKNNINIYKLYRVLYQLEIEDKKDSIEYKKHLEYLSIYIEIEDKIYNELKQSKSDLLEIALFLQNQINTNNEIDIITTKEYGIPVLKRILNNILSIIIERKKATTIKKKEEVKKLLSLLQIPNKLVPEEQTSNIILLQKKIKEDITYVFLSFLEEYILDPKYHYQREELKLAKYNTVFLNKNIEPYAIKTKFTFPTTPYIHSKIYVELLNIDNTTYTNIKNLISNNIATNEIYELLEINDLDYNDKEKTSISILRQCMIKSALSNMTDEEISNINYEFHEYIEDKEYEEIYPNNKVSENIIIYLFKTIKRELAKVKKISLKL